MELGTTICLIDDDNSTLNTIKNVIEKIFQDAVVLTANDGLDGLDIIRKQTKPFVVVANVNMQGISGLQILKKIRSDEKLLNDTYTILITSVADKELNLKVIKEGADDFLNTPFSVDNLIVKLRSAFRYANMQKNELKHAEEIKQMKEILNQNFNKTVLALRKLMLERFKDKKAILDEVHQSSTWIAEQMSDKPNEIEAISLAASIFEIGKLGLDDNFLNRPVLTNGINQLKQVEHVPLFVGELLSDLHGFNDIITILSSVYENFDGSGIPHKTKSWEIPLGSRIIRVAIDYQFFMDKFKKPSKAIDSLYHEAKRLYDYKVITYYDQYLAKLNSGVSGTEKPISLQHIAEEMMLTRNIVTHSGLMLMSKGTQLTEEKIERIVTIAKTDPIIGKIYIKS